MISTVSTIVRTIHAVIDNNESLFKELTKLVGFTTSGRGLAMSNIHNVFNEGGRTLQMITLKEYIMAHPLLASMSAEEVFDRLLLSENDPKGYVFLDLDEANEILENDPDISTNECKNKVKITLLKDSIITFLYVDPLYTLHMYEGLVLANGDKGDFYRGRSDNLVYMSPLCTVPTEYRYLRSKNLIYQPAAYVLSNPMYTNGFVLSHIGTSRVEIVKVTYACNDKLRTVPRYFGAQLYWVNVCGGLLCNSKGYIIDEQYTLQSDLIVYECDEGITGPTDVTYSDSLTEFCDDYVPVPGALKSRDKTTIYKYTLSYKTTLGDGAGKVCCSGAWCNDIIAKHYGGEYVAGSCATTYQTTRTAPPSSGQVTICTMGYAEVSYRSLGGVPYFAQTFSSSGVPIRNETFTP